jgi:hypothetical protein
MGLCAVLVAYFLQALLNIFCRNLSFNLREKKSLLTRNWRNKMSTPIFKFMSIPPSSCIGHAWYALTWRLCSGCHRDIGYGNYLGCMGKYFHPECFCCRSCGYPITETEVIILLKLTSILLSSLKETNLMKIFMVHYFCGWIESDVKIAYNVRNSNNDKKCFI